MNCTDLLYCLCTEEAFGWGHLWIYWLVKCVFLCVCVRLCVFQVRGKKKTLKERKKRKIEQVSWSSFHLPMYNHHHLLIFTLQQITQTAWLLPARHTDMACITHSLSLSLSLSLSHTHTRTHTHRDTHRDTQAHTRVLCRSNMFSTYLFLTHSLTHTACSMPHHSSPFILLTTRFHSALDAVSVFF